MVTPKGYNAIPVPMDDFGMTPEALEQVSVGNLMTHVNLTLKQLHINSQVYIHIPNHRTRIARQYIMTTSSAAALKS